MHISAFIPAAKILARLMSLPLSLLPD